MTKRPGRPGAQNDRAEGCLAARAGLVLRPLTSTVADTAAWLAARDNGDAWKNVLSAEREREILADRNP